MIKKLISVFLIFLFSNFFINVALAYSEPQVQLSQVNKIGLLLNELKVPYEINQGDYSVHVTWSYEKRGHDVYIMNAQRKLDDGTMLRSIVAPVFKIMNEGLTKEQLNEIMVINSDRTIGAFEVANNNQGDQFLVFRATIPDNFTASTLSTIINYVGACADSMEKELMNGKDEL